MQQEGSITCVEFYQGSHVFTGSEDGTICIFDTNSWECLKTLRGHKLGVNWLSVHPSGKMCLSVSKDKTLRTWNLIKGRCAYITNLKVVADLVRWSPTGQEFVIVVGSKLDVYNIATGAVTHSHEFGRRITCINFVSVSSFCLTSNYWPVLHQDDTIAIGGEAGLVRFFCIAKQKVVQEFTAHDNRVKELNWVKGSDLVQLGLNLKSAVTGFLFTISSDSHLKLWRVARVRILTKNYSNKFYLNLVGREAIVTCWSGHQVPTNLHDSGPSYCKWWGTGTIGIRRKCIKGCWSKRESETKVEDRDIKTCEKWCREKD